MSKMLFIAVSATALMTMSSAYAGTTRDYTPYIGLDYSYTTAKVESVKPHYNAIGVNIGTKYNDYFGTEAFYQQSSSNSKNFSESKFKSSYRSYGLDIAGYLPLGCYHQFDIIGSAGFGEYIFKKKLSGNKHRNDSGWGYRIGGGLAYNVNERFSLRVMARYVALDQISNFDHLTEYTAGIRYHFL